MVVAQAGRVGQRGARSDFLAVVGALFVERARGAFARTVGPRVVGVAVHGLPAVGLVEIEAHVGGGDQHVLQQVDRDRRAVVHVELAVFTPRVALDEACPARVYGRFRPRAVGIGDQGYGVSLVVEHARYRHRRCGDARVARRLVRIAVHEVGGVLHAQPRLYVDDAFGFDVELLVFLVAGVVDAVLLEHTARDVVRCHVTAACHADVVLVSGRIVLVEYVVPVGVAEVFVDVAVVDAPFLIRGVAVAACQFVVPGAREFEYVVDVRGILAECVDVGFQERGGIIVAVGDHLGFGGALVEGKGAVVSHLGAAFLRLFGGKEDHAEGAAGTVYGGRRGVLEHRDRLDVVRVHGRHVGFDAVDHHQGRAARTDRVLRAADAHRRAAVGLTVGKGHRKAGDGALQRARNAHRRTHTLFEALCRKGFDGAYDVAALLYAVADDDDLFEAGVVFAHGDVDGGLVVDVDCLGFVAHIAEIQAL